jgi:cell division protein FtsB
MIRLLCATNHCTAQAAELCHQRQQLAALRAELAAMTAERDALASQVAGLQRKATDAETGKTFYEGLFCDLAKGAKHGN